jgi:hypothetical protein
MSDNRATLPSALAQPQAPINALVGPPIQLGAYGQQPATLPQPSADLRAPIVAAPLPAQATAPPAVAGILSQKDPAFDQFWARMLPGESGGADVPNQQYKPGVTASGVAQITDTNWKAQAPKLGINATNPNAPGYFPTAMSAPPDYQKAVAKLMHREYGATPWDQAHGGALPVGADVAAADPGSPQALRAAALDAFQSAHAQELQSRAKLAAQLQGQSETLMRAATEAPPGSAERQKFLEEAQEQWREATKHYQYLSEHPPTEQPSTALSGFGALMLGLVALAGRRSAQPLTASLGAMGSALQAMNKGDMDTYKQQLDLWKYQSDMGLNLVKLHQEDITNILNSETMAWNQKQAQLSTLFKAAGLQTEAAKMENDPEAPYRYAQGLGDLMKNAELAQLKLFAAGTGLIKQNNYATALDAGKQAWYAAHPGQANIPATDLAKIQTDAAAKAGIQPPSKTETDPKAAAISKFLEENPQATAAEIANFARTVGQSGRQQATMLTRLTAAGNEVSGALQNLMELPVTANLGVFGGTQYQTADTLTDAVHRALARSLTPQEVQDLQATTLGLSRGLATLEATGVSQGLVGLAKQMEREVPQSGDTPLTVMRKYADVRQIVERAMETVKSTSAVPETQTALLDKIVAEVKRAVPFTVHDVNMLERSPDDPATVKAFSARVFANQRGGGSLPTVTSQAQYDALAPGAYYTGPDGGSYQKPGNK